MSHFDLDKVLGTVKNRVYRVGVELEGGWSKVPKFECGEKIERDGSIKGLDGSQGINNGGPIDFTRAIDIYNTTVPPRNRISVMHQDGRTRFVDTGGRFIQDEENLISQLRYFLSKRSGITVGEIAGPPLEPNKVEEWMKKCYPDHVNETCGLHVHVSFKKSLHYSRLMVPEYQASIITYLAKWAMNNKIDKGNPLWDRLAGKNEFCKHEFFADAQVKKTSKIYDHHGHGNRYTAVNFCHGQHETIECRILPMFKEVDMAISAVNQVIDITNACLKVTAKKEEVVSAKLIEDSMNVVREHRQEWV